MPLIKKCLFICLMLFTCKLQSQDLNFFDPPPLYVGIDAGSSFGIGKSSSEGSGRSFSGKSFDARAQSGWTINAQVGCLLNSWSRAEIQYVFLKNSYNWISDFGSGDIENFNANMHAHLALANYFLSLGSLFNSGSVEPYISVGVGVAFNSLFDIEERTPFGFGLPGDQVFARIQSHRHTNFCAQAGGGIKKRFCKNLLLNLKFNAYYLGKFKSGNTRDIVAIFPPIDNERIGPFKFENIWLGSVTLGLGYMF